MQLKAGASYRRSTLTNQMRNNLTGWGFALPALIGFVALNLIPMIMSLYYSLCEYSTVSIPRFIGLENYINLFNGTDPHFYPSIKATLKYAVMAVPANLLFSFAIAMMLNRPMKGRTFFRSVFYMPCIVPAVASGFTWMLLLNPEFGLFNNLLSTLGLPKSQFLWDEKSVIQTIVFIGIWATGGTQVVFLAGLQDIPSVYYEALVIDGGNAWHRLRYVTLPMLSSTIFFNLVNGLIGALQVFSAAYVMSGGGPNNASLFYVYNMWRKAFFYTDMGVASAMAWILFVVVMLMTLLVFKTSKAWVYYEGVTES